MTLRTKFISLILGFVILSIGIPILLFAQGWNGPTQTVWNSSTNTLMTVPTSWDVTSGNWNSLQSVFNPVTNTWVQVPLTWNIPTSTTGTVNPTNWVTPGSGSQVPGASSDPLNPGATTVTATPPGGSVNPMNITNNNRTIRDILRLGTRFLNVLIPVLIGLVTIVFMWGIISLLTNSGNEEKRMTAKQYMIGSIIALFILISAWGLVAVLSSTFGFQFALPQLQA